MPAGNNPATRTADADPAAPARERIAKSTETVGLYEAMDLASIWLERALKESAK